MKKRKKKKSGRALLAILIALLLIVAGVIAWRLREYQIGNDYYESLRGMMPGRLG